MYILLAACLPSLNSVCGSRTEACRHPLADAPEAANRLSQTWRVFSELPWRRGLNLLVNSCLGFVAKSQVAQARSVTDQLRVEPDGTDHAGLPLDASSRTNSLVKKFNGSLRDRCLNVN
ncbi:hypothetical protein [Delftia acidovorans]|uniref:Uncharacterized protein n=1 Tax=Delftia acidovorans TaxID=80866 RepID=A0AAJ2R2N7_DELAC|nr:hypothetical protein [Delftia acidovorans]MDX4956556.1 hypothetical protein [Delftia acidovorans]